MKCKGKKYWSATFEVLIAAWLLTSPAGAAPLFTGSAGWQSMDQVTGPSNRLVLSLSAAGDRAWLNPTGGLLLLAREADYRAGFISNDFRLSRHLRLHLALNHSEYQEYESGINFVNACLIYERSWVLATLGETYAVFLFPGDNWRAPLQFGSDISETHYIYEFALRPSLSWGGVQVGVRNFDDLEYFGADDNGIYVGPFLQLTGSTRLWAVYERRYAAVFIDAPGLTRVSWLVVVEHRF